jgi:hypothetical protein
LVQRFHVLNFLSWVPCCLCSKHSFVLWARLKIIDDKIWLSIEYQSCCLVIVHACEYFSFYHINCGRSLPVVGLERRIILIVDCFMCMVVLVLRITYDQVVLLRTVLNFVAWQLEKASKCSVVVCMLSLVIWITST